MPGWRYFTGIYFPAALLFSQDYNWPCEPFDQQHWINGTFCECRSGTSGDIDHFHDGVDIHLSQGGAVYSVINGSITSIGTPGQYGINSWVRVDRYAYVHVDPNPALSVGESVTAFETILGWTNSWNHIHFKDGYPGNEINALRTNGGLGPFTDTYGPTVHDIHFYTDGLEMEFINNQIYGMVNIVSRATDHTDDGPYGNNNGIVTIGYEVMDSLGTNVFGPVYPFSFTTVPAADSYVQYVYAPGSNTSNYRYIVSNNLYSNHSINVSNWSPGNYTFKVIAVDHSMNKDSLLHTIEITSPDTYPPDPPVIVSILSKDNGFDLQWLPNNEADLAGYRLYFSYDATSWNSNHNESVLTAEMTLFEAPSFSTSTGYFRMTAIDNAPIPNESQPSDIVVFRRSYGGQKLLFVNSFSQQNTASEHPYAGNAGLLADTHGIGIGTVNDTLFFIDSTFTIPASYLPIVFTGNSVNPLPDAFVNQLNNSSFWIIGSKSSESLTLSIPGTDLLENYLEVYFSGSFPIPNELIGIDAPYDNYSASNMITTIGIDNLNSFAGILDETLSYPIFTDTSGIIFGIAVADPPSILSSIPIEILGEDDRIDYFDRAMEFLVDTTLAISDEILIPKKPAITFYPNPFNTQGIIQIFGNPGKYHLTLYNILGQTVWEKKIQLSQPDGLSVRLPKFLSKRMSSGLYFILLKGQSSMFGSEKILYIR